MIPWWQVQFKQKDINSINRSIKSKHIGPGEETKKLEKKIKNLLKVKYCSMTTSGTAAIMLAIMTLGIKKGSEIIMPNRSWVSPANVLSFLGMKIKFIDMKKNSPIVDAELIRSKITKKTKLILLVHLNGRGGEVEKIKKIAKKKNIFLIEDSSQALMSKSNGNYLGNFSDISAYSLSMGKLASSGQGGFITTNNKKYYSIFNRIKNNGLKNNFETNWSNFGLNFKYTDIQASFVIPQIERIKKNIEKIKKNYEFMYDKIKEMKHISLVESKVKDGEIPLYFECFSKKSKKIKKLLLKSGIPIRNAYPSLNKFKRFNNTDEFPNSKYFEKNTFFLPSGIDVKKNLKAIIITLKKIDRNL